MTIMLTYPNIDPVLIKLGFIEIRWYSLAYIFGILIASKFIEKNIKNPANIKSFFDDLIAFLAVGIIIGGRLFYVLFYGISDFIRNPIDIFKIWEGGMSFHGGLVGAIFGMFLLSKKQKVPFFKVLDLAAIVAPIGIFFGRIANFINGELYGRVTNLPIGMIFPSDPLGLPRHPSQVYEALGEGLMLFLILFFLFKKTRIIEKKMMTSGLFLSLYGIIRFCIEYTREPDSHIGFVFMNFSMGQILCSTMIAAGLAIIYIFGIKHEDSKHRKS